MSTSRPGSRTPAGGCSSSAFATEKIEVLAPMPIASDTAAVAVNSGLCRSKRAACRRSRRMSSSQFAMTDSSGHRNQRSNRKKNRSATEREDAAGDRNPKPVTAIEPVGERPEYHVRRRLESAEQQTQHQPPDSQRKRR